MHVKQRKKIDQAHELAKRVDEFAGSANRLNSLLLALGVEEVPPGFGFLDSLRNVADEELKKLTLQAGEEALAERLNAPVEMAGPA